MKKKFTTHRNFTHHLIVFFTFLTIAISISHPTKAQNLKVEDIQCQTVTEFINKLKRELPDATWKVDRKRDDGSSMNKLKVDITRNNVIWKVKNPKTGNEKLADAYTIALHLDRVTNVETYYAAPPPTNTNTPAPPPTANIIEKPNEYYSPWHFSEKSDSIRKALEKKYKVSNDMKNKGDNSYKANTLEQKNKLVNLSIEHRLQLDNLKNKNGNITYTPPPPKNQLATNNKPTPKPVPYIANDGFYLKDGLILYKVTDIEYPTEHISLEPKRVATEAEVIYNKVLQLLPNK